MLSCVRYRSRLGAFLDGELNRRKSNAIAAHVAGCAACQKRIEDIRGLEGVLRSASLVPALPDGLAARVMAEARRKRRAEKIEQKPFFAMMWNPVRWIAQLSAPMRIAACVTMLLAFAAGIGLNGSQSTGVAMNGEPENSIYGLEWFEPVMPDSIGSVYYALITRSDATRSDATRSDEKGNMR